MFELSRHDRGGPILASERVRDALEDEKSASYILPTMNSIFLMSYSELQRDGPGLFESWMPRRRENHIHRACPSYKAIIMRKSIVHKFTPDAETQAARELK